MTIQQFKQIQEETNHLTPVNGHILVIQDTTQHNEEYTQTDSGLFLPAQSEPILGSGLFTKAIVLNNNPDSKTLSQQTPDIAELKPGKIVYVLANTFSHREILTTPIPVFIIDPRQIVAVSTTPLPTE